MPNFSLVNNMFPIKAQHVRRVKFVSRMYPKVSSTINLSTDKLRALDGIDGDVFLGGRSKNKQLLSYLGFIHDNSHNASFFQLPNFRRSLRKLTNLVEQELELLGGQEILMPTLVPQDLWKLSKRFERQPDALDHVYKFKDNAGADLLLGPTFEESVSQLVADGMQVYEQDLPILLYQTSPKFRYEPHPCFGLVRSREFVMNDLYSFDANLENARRTYDRVSNAYDKIFTRLGLDYTKTVAATGNIGGKYSHEYHLKVSSGEDVINKCNKCQTAFNMELLSGNSNGGDAKDPSKCVNCNSGDLEQIRTLELGHTFLLSDTYSKPMKVKYTDSQTDKRLNLEMGCFGLGLSRIIGASIDLMSIIPGNESKAHELVQIRWPDGIEPFKLGVVTPAKRSKPFHGNSTAYAEELTNRILETSKSVDIVIEDRDKEGIGRRVLRLQSLGIPNIVVIGQRFLQQEPEVELLKLDASKKAYEQLWFTTDQLCDYIKTQLDK